jgi:hypothetical protein
LQGAENHRESNSSTDFVCFPWKKGCAFEAAFLSASPIQRQGADVRCWRILGDLADALETASDSS